MSVKEKKERLSTVPDFSLSFLLPKYWLVWFGLLLFYFLSWMPVKILDAFANKLGELTAKKNKKRFNIARTNLSLCFPDKAALEVNDMVLAHFRAQARAIIQYGLLWWHPTALLKKHIEVVGLEQVEAVKEKGDTVILNFPTYPNGFPSEIMEEFEKRAGVKTIGNYPQSGTIILDELGEEHLKTGHPIVYTSADSVFQIAKIAKSKVEKSAKTVLHQIIGVANFLDDEEESPHRPQSANRRRA